MKAGDGANRDENLGAWPRTEAMIRDQIAEYYGMVTHLDGQIRRILDALEAAGQRKNTIVVFAADNGLALGSHGLLGKQSVYEHSTHVPMMIVRPRRAGGTQHTRLLVRPRPLPDDHRTGRRDRSGRRGRHVVATGAAGHAPSAPATRSSRCT